MGFGVESHGTLHCPCKLEAALSAASTSTPRAPRPAPAVCVQCGGDKLVAKIKTKSVFSKCYNAPLSTTHLL
jgi:hypothetical protein